MFDWNKPTAEMLGRWQPWHDGHTALFEKALKKTGQVCIMFRDVSGVDAGVDGQGDNPFEFEEVKKRIEASDIDYFDKPYRRFIGSKFEQETFFVEDPNGNVLEIKTMSNPEVLFETAS